MEVMEYQSDLLNLIPVTWRTRRPSKKIHRRKGGRSAKEGQKPILDDLSLEPMKETIQTKSSLQEADERISPFLENNGLSVVKTRQNLVELQKNERKDWIHCHHLAVSEVSSEDLHPKSISEISTNENDGYSHLSHS